MGRRDEPNLDELKKLLRRLESMEAESRHGGRNAAADVARTGYIGALRGAAAVAADDPRHGPFNDYGRASDADAKPRSSGMASIVIGAATAAVVSSIAAVALLLWAGGQDSSVGREPRAPAAGTAPRNAGPASLHAPRPEQRAPFAPAAAALTKATQ